MIHKRRVARRRRIGRQRVILSQIQNQDLRVEAGFEGSLAAKDAHFEDCFDGLHCAEWWALVQSWLTEIQMVFELLAQPKAARREKARA